MKIHQLLGMTSVMLLLVPLAGGCIRIKTSENAPTPSPVGPTPTASPVVATPTVKPEGEITSDQLALMTLPKADLGEDYATFQLAVDAGFESNQQNIEDDRDPEDEARDVEQFGRVNGYSAGFESSAAVLAREGAYVVGTSVELFDEAAGASGYLWDDVADLERDIAKTSEGLTLTHVERFGVETVGDESAGLRLTLSFGDEGETLPVYATYVMFRRGWIVAYAVSARFDQNDVAGEVEALARKLDQRIQAVLRGELMPTPTPQLGQATSESAPAPEEPPYRSAPTEVLETFHCLSQISLDVDTGGVIVRREGDFESPDRVACTLATTLGGVQVSRDQLVVIGKAAWMDTGAGWRATSLEDSSLLDDLSKCPCSPIFWEGTAWMADLAAWEGVPESVNSVPATRYALAEAARAAGPLGVLPAEMGEMNFEAYDIWLAENGGWPVAYYIHLSGDAQALGRAVELGFEPPAGKQGQWKERVDISQPNSSDIHVEPPIEP